MRKIFLLTLFVFCALVLPAAAQGIKQNLASGEVTAISDSKITLKTTDGVIDAMLSTTTEYKRVPPENPSLKAAVASSFAEVGVGGKGFITSFGGGRQKNDACKSGLYFKQIRHRAKTTKRSRMADTRNVGKNYGN
ncbi:MAG TPA: hypothetical protein PKE69_18815 [Pyrinomonadaceae bacterium]|nr:hypothetical protein [Pyrinomonadaceae bacterium]